MSTYLGVNACPAGWFATILTDHVVETQCYPNFADLWETHSNADRILVDILIGLPETGTRECDERARILLGCRGSSVFDAICRPLLDVETYDTANARYRELAGKGLSQQAWHLREKIAQVDHIGQNDQRAPDVLRESHPELCFYGLNYYQPIAYSKTSDRGQQQRRRLLREHLADADRL